MNGDTLFESHETDFCSNPHDAVFHGNLAEHFLLISMNNHHLPSMVDPDVLTSCLSNGLNVTVLHLVENLIS